MKIFYDHQVFTYQDYGGASRCFCELMKYFRQDGKPDFEVSARYSNNYHLKNLNLGKRRDFFKDYNFRGRFRLMTILNTLESKKMLRRGDFDVFHPTYYDPYFLKYIKSRPFVLTVHDMIHELFPRYFPGRDKTRAYKRILARKAAKIISVSENTKKDIVRLLGVDESKIVVVYHGNSLSSASSRRPEEWVSTGKYLLFAGSRMGYKNFIPFIEAVQPILKREKDLNIVCAGGGSFSNSEKAVFKKLGLEEKIRYVPASDNQMFWLYHNALALALPSLYEGFGIPVLEAFGCGCPVLLSRAGSLPEIAGEAAVYFDPHSLSSIKEAVDKVVCDERLRDRLREEGFNRLKNFSWQKAAQRTQEVYQNIIN